MKLAFILVSYLRVSSFIHYVQGMTMKFEGTRKKDELI